MFAMKMEVAGSSETLVNIYWARRHHIGENSNLFQFRRNASCLCLAIGHRGNSIQTCTTITQYLLLSLYVPTDNIVTCMGFVTNNYWVPDHFNRFIEHTEIVTTI
jgi:hypothetical protein